LPAQLPVVPYGVVVEAPRQDDSLGSGPQVGTEALWEFAEFGLDRPEQVAESVLGSFPRGLVGVESFVGCMSQVFRALPQHFRVLVGNRLCNR